MKSSEFTDNVLSPELEQLINAAIVAGDKMAQSKSLRYQLYMPKDKSELTEDFKPMAKRWTSTAELRAWGGTPLKSSYSSAWVEWVNNNMPEWGSDVGLLYKIESGAKVLNMGSDATALKISKILGKDLSGNKWSRLSEYPWEEIGKHFDAVRYPARLSGKWGSRSENILMSLWDVESTAWYNTDKLTLIGKVKITPRNW